MLVGVYLLDILRVLAFRRRGQHPPRPSHCPWAKRKGRAREGRGAGRCGGCNAGRARGRAGCGGGLERGGEEEEEEEEEGKYDDGSEDAGSEQNSAASEEGKKRKAVIAKQAGYSDQKSGDEDNDGDDEHPVHRGTRNLPAAEPTPNTRMQPPALP